MQLGITTWTRMCGSRGRLSQFAGLMLLVAMLSVGGGAPAAAAGPVTEAGYIPMEDGTLLRYSLERPEGDGPFPAVLQYNGYGAGSSPRDNGLDALTTRLLEEGFAVVGVNLRGTGCSEGTFDLFEPQTSDDGVTVVEWIASQPWSNGKVGMAGGSYSGITQLMVASRRPEQLAAIAPNVPITDLYRDVAWPGGIFNQTFSYGWTGIQKNGHEYVPEELADANLDCLSNVATQNDPAKIVGVETQTRPYADDEWYERFLTADEISAIDIPVLAYSSWQDEQLGARVTDAYSDLDNRRTWLVLGNGSHSAAIPSRIYNESMVAFFRRYLLGERNDWEATPRVQLLHEVNNAYQPGWISTHRTWPVPTVTRTLYLEPNGTLGVPAPATPATFSYNYPLPAPSVLRTFRTDEPVLSYKAPVPAGGSISFTSPAMTEDVEILGPLSLDLWLSSTGTETDLQVTVTEVRPDGNEWYVNRGWLRASKRTLDREKSMPTRPVQTFAKHDAAPLTPGVPTPMRIEIWPVNHTIRAGSALRVYVEAPVGFTGFRQLQYHPVPAVNTVHVGPEHPSRLVFGQVRGATAPVGLPACDSVMNQPCRPDGSVVPEGDLRFPSE